MHIVYDYTTFIILRDTYPEYMRNLNTQVSQKVYNHLSWSRCSLRKVSCKTRRVIASSCNMDTDESWTFPLNIERKTWELEAYQATVRRQHRIIIRFIYRRKTSTWDLVFCISNLHATSPALYCRILVVSLKIFFFSSSFSFSERWCQHVRCHIRCTGSWKEEITEII